MTRVALLALVLCGSRAAHADSAGGIIGEHIEPNLVGEVLASEALGASDLKAVTPGSTQEAVTALRSFDKDGRLAPGVAVEVTPFALWLGRGLTFTDYVGSFWMRTFARASLSLATQGEGSGDKTVVRSGLALRVRLADGSDWRLNGKAIDCALNATSTADPGTAPPDGMITTPKTPKEMNDKADACFTDHLRDAKWNGLQAAFGVVTTLRSPGGVFNSTAPETFGAYLGASVGVSSWLNVIGSARFTHQFAVNDVGLTTALSDVLGAGLRLTAKQDWLAFSLDGGLGKEWDIANASKVKALLGATMQIRAGDGLWVEFGGKYHSDRDGVTIDSGLKWNYDLVPKGK